MISMVSAVASSGKLTFTAVRNVPEEYRVESHGILFGYASTKTEDEMKPLLVLTNNAATKGVSTSRTNNGQFSININNPVKGVTYFARAYMILKDKDGNSITCYSDNVLSKKAAE